jgi:hypothetical protein
VVDERRARAAEGSLAARAERAGAEEGGRMLSEGHVDSRKRERGNADLERET